MVRLESGVGVGRIKTFGSGWGEAGGPVSAVSIAVVVVVVVSWSAVSAGDGLDLEALLEGFVEEEGFFAAGFLRVVRGAIGDDAVVDERIYCDEYSEWLAFYAFVCLLACLLVCLLYLIDVDVGVSDHEHVCPNSRVN